MIRMFPARPLIPGWARVAAVCLAALIAIAAAAHQWDRLWAWLPWSAEARLERVVRDRDRWAAEAAARAAEARLLNAQLRRVETAQRRVVELRDLTAPVIHQARSAPDANQPLDPDRADRLRDHDRRLCELAPGACAAAPAAASDPAGAGDAAMSAGDPG